VMAALTGIAIAKIRYYRTPPPDHDIGTGTDKLPGLQLFGQK
jgi:hypothetical protein